MDLFMSVLSLSAEEISGIIAGVCAGIVSIIVAIGNIINNQRRKQGNMTCCMTGRKLKHKKNKSKKPHK